MFTISALGLKILKADEEMKGIELGPKARYGFMKII